MDSDYILQNPNNRPKTDIEQAREIMSRQALTPRVEPPVLPLTGKALADHIFPLLDGNGDGKVSMVEFRNAPQNLLPTVELVRSNFDKISKLSNDDFGTEIDVSRKDLTAFLESKHYKFISYDGPAKDLAKNLQKTLENSDYDGFLVTMKQLHGHPAARVILPLLAEAITEKGLKSSVSFHGDSAALKISRDFPYDWDLTVGTSGSGDFRKYGKHRSTARDAFAAVVKKWEQN